jgi:RNA polymerase sigma-70 factor (ECF subfamily)
MVRLRRRLRGVEFALPPPEERAAALDTTHAALYLLFNEGHLSTDEEPIRRELCRAAMELVQLLADEPSLCSSDTLGLLALMSFQAARLDSRLDANGDVVPLDRQDRSRWDRALIGRGYAALVRASRMEAVVASRYHLEAAIAARHCAARAFAETDWGSICSLYDRLLERGPSPLTELNRAVAVSYRDGPEAAIPLVEELRRSQRLAGSHAVAAVLANLYARTGAARELFAKILVGGESGGGDKSSRAMGNDPDRLRWTSFQLGPHQIGEAATAIRQGQAPVVWKRYDVIGL